ncbi:MAG: NifB/NifX family molybdenum-iron cluster-binding protein [Syntrophaceae bacterium]|nr:NifB/NifX family molybdenum-iron cluster-binding protein [Syntrophaceae bacterium]
MKLALSVFKDSISTVFDAADQILIVDTDGTNNFTKKPVKFVWTDPVECTAQLKCMGVETLICGAISFPMQALIMSQGIKVHSFVRGEVDTVINAYQNNRLAQAIFSLPGCRRRNMRMRSGKQRGRRYTWK